MNGKKIFGDYQTPYEFAEKVCHLLKEKYHSPLTVLEPTCGIGNFLKASLIFDAKSYFGLEINGSYCNQCELSILDNRVQIINADIFNYDLYQLLNGKNEVLVIGNPPWVTNSDLSRQDGTNLPRKQNIKALAGFDAITGASNFDICEYIILQMIELICMRQSTLAMLCKTSVARNVFKEINRRNIKYNSCAIYNFNAQKIFNITAAACLLVIEFNYSAKTNNTCDIFNLDSDDIPLESLVYTDGDIRNYSALEYDFSGKSCFEWRQGVKHDCSKIMELSYNGTTYFNGNNELVDIENNYVFPLIKSSMFKKPIISSSKKFVIVTQSKIKEDTTPIQNLAPKTWDYLFSHKEYFEKRKSSIYKNTPLFSMFGVGDYSFSKYKVGISGFYKKPFFSLLNGDSKPIMTDDTGYFISLETYDLAYIAMLCLNSKQVQDFLIQTSFQDAKRPYTKQILNNIDFSKIVNTLTIDDLLATEVEIKLPPYASPQMYDIFKHYINGNLPN